MSPRARSIPAELLSRVDPGWLFLMTGLVLTTWVVVIPAQDDLARARWLRDQVRSEAAYRGEQLAVYSDFLGAVHSRDPKVVRWLAASQLNVVVGDREILPVRTGVSRREAGILGLLSPRYTPPAAAGPPDSLLHRVATDERARLWVLIGGLLCVFYGLLPPTSPAVPIDETDAAADLD